MNAAHSISAAFNLATSGGTGGGSSATITPTIGGAPVIFAHFAQGGGYQTTFAFNNLTNKQATVTLNFYAQNGTLTGSVPLGINGLGSVGYAMSGAYDRMGPSRCNSIRGSCRN
jgi:hypothetical protein